MGWSILYVYLTFSYCTVVNYLGMMFRGVYCSFFFMFPQYIGTKETDQRADEVLRLEIMDLWTPENHYRWTRSRYGGHVSASVDSVEHSRLLLCSMFLKLSMVLWNYLRRFSILFNYWSLLAQMLMSGNLRESSPKSWS